MAAKLEKIEGSENYCATIVALPPKQKVEGLDKLVKVTVFGNDVLVGKDADETVDYIFFPVECRISSDYLGINNEFRNKSLNLDNTKSGFFEDTGRVKAIKFKGVISTGYMAPIDSLPERLRDVRLGDEFNKINGEEICRKYKVVRTEGSGPKESRFNKKLKRFDKLVPNQFRFHESTSQLAKNLHQFNPEDIIVITDKWHGTSAVFSNVLIKKELPIKARIAKFFGVEIVDKQYDNLYSSRSVIKNQYINKDATAGYYNEDIWAIVNKEIEGKIEAGISIFGEIVGYLPSGKMVQKDYDYNANLQPTVDGSWPHKFVVYRMTYTKPDGSLIEFSWQQIKDYCKKHSLETVKQLYFGKAAEFIVDNSDEFDKEFSELLFNTLSIAYLERDCKHCKNKVPAEGICIRLDGRESYMTYKLKSKRFLEKETKDLDAGVENIEEDQQVTEQI